MTEQAKTFEDPGNFIEALIADFADGTFDGLDSTGTAITVSDPTAGDTTLAVDAGTTGFTTAVDDYTTGTDNVFVDSGIALDDLTDILSDITTGVEANVVESDTTVPTVSSKSPSADATDIAITTTVTATFSEAMDDTTITDSSFTLEQGATAVAGAVTYDTTSKTATFTPTASLAEGTTYTATLSVAMTDSVGNALVSITWDFTTSAPATTLIGGEVQGVELSLSNTVSTLAGTGTAGFLNHTTGTSAQFNYPYCVTTDGLNLYVADTDNNTIRQIVIATGVVTTLAGGEAFSNSGTADGTGTAARFNSPHGVTTDGTYIWVADRLNHAIRRIEISSGTVTTIAGTIGTSGSADGTGTAATFFRPTGITTDGTNLYVTDDGNLLIRKIVISSGEVTTFAGTSGTWGHVDDTGTAAQFYAPRGITTDGTNLYVVEFYNYAVRQIVIASQVVTTLAGGTWGSADGTGTAAQFNYPFGVATDGVNLYIGDDGNNLIRKIVIATGVVTTIAGSGTSAFTDGTGTSAEFYAPRGVTTDGTSLYVIDGLNHAIRKIE